MVDEAKNPVVTTKRTLEIIDALKELEGAGVTEIAKQVDFSKSGVHNHLSTLKEYNYVVKSGDKYHLGLKFLEIGSYTRNQIQIFKRGKSEVDRLATETNEMANLVTEENGMGVYLYRSFGENAIDLNADAGTRSYLHNQALGKAILAHLPEERVDWIIHEYGLPKTTERTISDRDELLSELDKIRQQGYAIDDEEMTRGLMCIAAPLLKDEEILGSISISGPKNRMTKEGYRDELRSKVMDTANVIELQVRY